MVRKAANTITPIVVAHGKIIIAGERREEKTLHLREIGKFLCPQFQNYTIKVSDHWARSRDCPTHTRLLVKKSTRRHTEKFYHRGPGPWVLADTKSQESGANWEFITAIRGETVPMTCS